MNILENATVIECSDCRKKIAQVLVREAPESWKVRVKCCFCDGESFTKEFKGVIAPGGYGKPNPDNENEVIPVTNLYDFQYREDNLCYVIVTKAK